MGKALKILVCFFLLPLSIAAVVLAHIIYSKREQIIARNQILTSGYIKLAPTLEDSLVDPPEQPPQYPAKDISACTSDFLDKTNEVSDFWTKKYDPKIELGVKDMFDINKRKLDLMTLYKKNQLGEIEEDPITGAKKMDGEGTMQALLDELFNKSKTQLERLNEARQMVGIVREELIETINDLNKTKVDLRKRTKDLEDTKAKLEATETELASTKKKLEDCEAAKKVAEDKVADLEKQKADVEAKCQELEMENKKLAKKIADMAKQVGTEPVGPGLQTAPIWNYTPGVKGSVAAVNERWNYVLIKLDDAFVKEVIGDDPAAPKPAPTGIVMSLKRKDAFVAKVKLTQIRLKDKYAIGDLIPEWKQQPPKLGDQMFFP